MNADTPAMILASSSPRRRAILGAMGISFEAVISGVDEEGITSDSPRALVMKIAAAKAAAVAEKLRAQFAAAGRRAVVLGADTEVILDGEIFGKPADRADAARMLRRLSGRTHEVVTGLALVTIPDAGCWLDAERTRVTFQPLEDDFIASYVSSGEADDKAGAYGIQGEGAKLIARVEGELSNVIGLPIRALREGWRAVAGEEIARAEPERPILARAYPEMMRSLVPAVFAES